VTRIFRRLINNWPLKVAAVGLATLMYGGLALSQNTQQYTGGIQVRPVNVPPDTFILTGPAPVTTIRYFAASGVPVAATSFLATVDLQGVPATGSFVPVPIDVQALDERIRIISYEPSMTSIQLDEVIEKEVPVRVEHGTVPDGLNLGETTVVPDTVTITGPKSVVSTVAAVRAAVIVQTPPIDIDQDVPLVPIDQLGNAVSPVDVEPPTARVTMPVISDQKSRTLPVNPIITGNPAAGFEIESVTVDPLTVLVAGDADDLAKLNQADTDPIPMTGVSADETVVVGLVLPTGVAAVDEKPIRVSIKIRPVTGTRTFSAGLRLVGANSTLTYALSVDRVLVTIGGSTADLDRLSGAGLVMDLDVSGLKAGTHDVPVTANLPVGTTVVAVSPPTVTVTIGTTAVTAPSGSTSPQPGG
jgi:YbbR domain-containing protein